MRPLESKTIGDFCRAVRTKNELTQAALAKKLGITQAVVAEIELDKKEYPIGYVKRLRPLLTAHEFNHAVVLFSKKLKDELQAS